MEYAAPVMEMSEEEDMEALNKRLQLASSLWNYSIEDKVGPRFTRKELIKRIETVLKKPEKEAGEFFDLMVERKNFLFPAEFQEKGSPFMVMRKELRHLIARFDFDRLKFSVDPIPPDKEDRAFIAKIKELDSYMLKGAEYDTYESLFVSIQEECTGVFGKWLKAKGLDEYAEELVWHPEVFCRFVYGYLHEDVLIFKSVPAPYMIEFFSDFALRKLIIEPSQYPYIPASLKLFYLFLTEKGYMENPEVVTDIIEEIEPQFIELLKERF